MRKALDRESIEVDSVPPALTGERAVLPAAPAGTYVVVSSVANGPFLSSEFFFQALVFI
jgi:hypothetical protein